MTDEQIIKALEACPSGQCGDCECYIANPYKYTDECKANLMNEALKLIKRQNAEIEEHREKEMTEDENNA